MTSMLTNEHRFTHQPAVMVIADGPM